MRTYDVIIILDEKKAEDGGEAFAKDATSYLKSLGGDIKERVAMGRRGFARPIGKNTSGVYLEFVVALDPAKVAVLKDKYRLTPAVLRMQVLNYKTPIPSGRPAAAAAVAEEGQRPA